MERAQIPLYLHLERADLASAVYTDILAGHPGDTVVYDTLRDTDPADPHRGRAHPGPGGKPDAIDSLVGGDEGPRPGRAPRRRGRAWIDQGHPEAVAPLIDALKDSYWFVRSERPTPSARSMTPRGQTAARHRADSDNTVKTRRKTRCLLLCVGRAKRRPLPPRTNLPAGSTTRIPKVVADLGGLPRHPEGFACHPGAAKAARRRPT